MKKTTNQNKLLSHHEVK